MLIWFMNKIYLFFNFILVCSVQSYLLPFSYRLRLRKLTKAEDRNPPITAHTLTTVWPSCYWLLAAKWRTCNSLFGFELQNSPALGSEEKEEKTKFWGRLVESVTVFQKAIIESTFDYWIETEYEYWIVHFMNGLLNEQTKSFSH